MIKATLVIKFTMSSKCFVLLVYDFTSCRKHREQNFVYYFDYSQGHICFRCWKNDQRTINGQNCCMPDDDDDDGNGDVDIVTDLFIKLYNTSRQRNF